MKFNITLTLILVVVCLHAQTRRIAHRFHSGDDYSRYDGRDGNYGIPMPHPAPATQIRVVIDSVRESDGRIYYRWDTITYSTPARINTEQHKRVARMRDLGNICTTLTER